MLISELISIKIIALIHKIKYVQFMSLFNELMYVCLIYEYAFHLLILFIMNFYFIIRKLYQKKKHVFMY